MIFDYIADVIYLIDMVLVQPRVKYLCDGFWVIEMKMLRKSYIKSKRFKVISVLFHLADFEINSMATGKTSLSRMFAYNEANELSAKESSFL